MKKIKGWRGVFLIVYTWLILMAYAVVYVDVMSFEARRRFYFVSVAEALLLISVLVCPRLLNWAESLSIKSEVFNKTEKAKFFFRTWFIILGIFFMMYLLFYPGGLGFDNIYQYSQAIGIEQYNDHHPVLHTLFAYTLPLKLTNGWIGSMALFQIIIFSLSLAYMACIIKEYSNNSYAKFFLLYIMLNPSTLCLAVSLGKDTSFSIMALLLMLFAVKTHFTKGKWLADIKHSIIFLIVMTLATIFRHNAILFTLPVLFAVSLYIKKKQAVLMLLCFLSLVYFVKYPLYNFLNVERPTNNRQIETLGLPMSIIGNAVKESHEKLDDEILEFAYSVATQEAWEKYFELYIGFDSIKDAGARQELSNIIHIKAIEEAGWKKILRLTSRCFKEAPFEALRGMLAVTNFVHGIAGHGLGIVKPVIIENNLGLKSNNFFSLNFLSGIITKHFPSYYRSSLANNNSISLQTLIIIIFSAVVVLCKYIFQSIGVINLVVLVFILAKLKFNLKHDWKKLCLVLPLFTYNFGTMLLLTSPLFRVFYYSYLIFPLIFLVLLKDEVN